MPSRLTEFETSGPRPALTHHSARSAVEGGARGSKQAGASFGAALSDRLDQFKIGALKCQKMLSKKRDRMFSFI